jgi:probable O-glycosylation ligase (exosortase A-associated)
MIHQLLFVALYITLLPLMWFSPFVGALLYQWLDNLPPDEVYSANLGYLSFMTGALTFMLWLIIEKKTLPRPIFVTLLMIMLLIWENITWLYAAVPAAGAFEWDRTVKVIGFAILTAQMLYTRERLEAYIWVFVLSVIYFAIPGAIKFIVSGGSGGIGEGEVVVAANLSFFGDRVGFAVVLAMAMPFALYLSRRATLLPPRWSRWAKPGMLGATACFLLALLGTFARTAVFTGGAVLLMLSARSQRKVLAGLAVLGTIGALYLIAPENWFGRMETIGDYATEGSAAGRIAAWKWAWAYALEHPIVGGGFGVFVLDAGSIPGRPGWLEAHNIFFSTLGKHGFVGLAIFSCLVLCIYRSCATVQKRAARTEELAWAADLARATQIALVGFIVGGMFISIEGTPALYMLGGITSGLRGLVERQLATTVRRPRSVAPAPIPAHAAE